MSSVVSNNCTMIKGPSILIKGTLGKAIEPSCIAYSRTSLAETVLRKVKNSSSMEGGKVSLKYSMSGNVCV